MAISTISDAKAVTYAGAVLQVVQGTYSTIVSNSTTTYADTNLTATITPKFSTSKILVFVDQADVYASTVGTGIKIKLLRNSTDICTFTTYSAYVGTGSDVDTGTSSTNYLDSPATTSAITYKTQFARAQGASGLVYVQNAGATSTITLMEIAG